MESNTAHQSIYNKFQTQEARTNKRGPVDWFTYHQKLQHIVAILQPQIWVCLQWNVCANVRHWGESNHYCLKWTYVPSSLPAFHYKNTVIWAASTWKETRPTNLSHIYVWKSILPSRIRSVTYFRASLDGRSTPAGKRGNLVSSLFATSNRYMRSDCRFLSNPDRYRRAHPNTAREDHREAEQQEYAKERIRRICHRET